MRIFRLFLFALFFTCRLAHAEVQTKDIEYHYEGVTLKGMLAWDPAHAKEKRPGVLVVHEFWGLNDYARTRAKQLAELGYVAFAADMYGEGKNTEHPEEATAMMNAVKENLSLWLGRANAALAVLRKSPLVASKNLAVIGYCFGGATALQLAYSGADIKAAVSFHGALPMPTSTKKIKASILILQGEKDPFVTPETVSQLDHILTKGNVRHRVVLYPNAGHSFTVPGAEHHHMAGVAYNAAADKASWKEMQDLFKNVFSK